MTNSIAIVGAGGHAKVVAGLLRALAIPVRGFFDDDPAKRGTTVLGLPVVAISELDEGAPAVLAVGSNRAREQLANRLHCAWTTLVHPRAWVDPTAQLGEGTVVFAGAMIQPDVVVGRHVIVNTAASIDHDSVLGDYVHVAPGVHLAGNVVVDVGAFLGVGSSAIPGRRVGAWSTVGAGGAVVRDIEAGVVAVGVPARSLSRGG